MAIGTYSIVENNNVAEGALTVTEGCNFTGNTVKSLTISGKNVYAANNTVLTTVTIAAAAKNTTFEENEVNGLVTVNSNDNTIVRNKVTTTTPYANDLKSTSNNTVTYNGDEFINVDTDSTTFIGLDNVVTEDIFYEYFDEYGFLNEEVPFDELIFKGEFDKLSYYVILDRPIKITGQDAVLKDIAFVIDSTDVSLDGLTLTSTMN